MLPKLSIELFPPKDQGGEDKMWRAVNQLQGFDLNSISVTYGAGGSVRDRTIKIAKELRLFINVPVTAHLTCVNSNRQELSQIVDEYEEAGIKIFWHCGETQSVAQNLPGLRLRVDLIMQIN